MFPGPRGRAARPGRSMDVLSICLRVILQIALNRAVQRWDRARLSPERVERAWNGASWGAALYAFGPLSMLGWVWVTRQETRRWWRRSPPRAVLWSGGLLFIGLVVGVLIV